jgi:plasmid stability protein
MTIKNIPDELYEKLRAAAENNRRSINSEIIVCIERAVSTRRINPEEILNDARRLRQLTAKHPITNDKFNQAKTQGRL